MENIEKASGISNEENSCKKVGPFQVDKVYLMDCLDGMKLLPDNSIDIMIADPPYNASMGNKLEWNNSVQLPGFGGKWSKIMEEWDNMPLDEYFQFTYQWLYEAKRIVKPTGSMWVHGTFHNIGIINFVMQILNIEIINEVIWIKRNSFPNLSGRRLTASHETIIWAHTGGTKRRYFFNYDLAKAMPSDGDRFKEPGKQMRTMWDIPNNKERREIIYGKHPSQKPLRLLKRMLSISSKKGDLLLAPFCGSGSECVAAKELGRHFLGFEKNKDYFNLSIERLSHAFISDQELDTDSKVDRTKNVQYTLFDTQLKLVKVPPLIKWTGGKRSQVPFIVNYVPNYNRYFEPFLGGGALLFVLGKAGALAGDIYCPLIDLWNLIKSDPESVIENYRIQWNLLQSNLPAYYYEVRERYNANPNPLDLNFLTRTCVNGIIRFNEKGLFNNSFHLSRRGIEPDKFAKIVRTWHKVIQGVTFVCQDYEETLKDATQGDFVYLDPPYANSNMRYTKNLDLDRFIKVLKDLNQRGVKWALSFDGRRGTTDLSVNIPQEIYIRKYLLPSGNSPVKKVLSGPIEEVYESLYLNY